MRRARLVLAVLLAAPGCSLLGLYDTPPVGDCPAPFRTCGEDCVDLENDAEHCLDCDAPCRADQICDGGCICRPGLLECDGSPPCVDLSSDPAHCGDCARACLPGEVCDDGLCTAECSGSREPCTSGACVDFTVDPLHCGNCDTRCAEDQICFAGACRDYRPALSDTCDTADCDEEEECCIAHTAQVCVTVQRDAPNCP